MKPHTAHRLLPLLFLTLASACTPDKSGKDKAAITLDYKSHTDAKMLSVLEGRLRGDTTGVDPAFDLYFDFSSTMSRAVSDKAYSSLITQSINSSDEKTTCYVIGANPDLKPVTGDRSVLSNTFLNLRSYTENYTYLTANLNNIAAHPQRPAIMFTDFSVDENKPTTDMQGVTSSFARGPWFKDQFAGWFNAGGSVKIYGKWSMAGRENMPIYVIAFLPDELPASHKVNAIISQLDTQLRDIYFDLHPDFVKVNAEPNGARLSDHLNYSQSKGGKTLDNDMGEVLIYEGDALLSNLKKDAKNAAISFFGGLTFTTDSTAYLADPEFDLVVNEYKAANKKELSRDLDGAVAFFNAVSQTPDGGLDIPMNTKEGKLDKHYQKPRFIRIALTAKAGALNFDATRAAKDLAYEMPNGRKRLLNDCLFESISKGLDDALRKNQPRVVYTINAFIKPVK
jgi:hypothetical protein